VTYAALLVPVLNLLIMPAAVAGATLFWVREGGPNRQLDRPA
jgi:CysZ protein